MKNILMVAGILIMLTACGGGGNDKKVRLEQLKKDYEKLGKEIAALEKEVNPESNLAAAINVATDILSKKPFEHYIEVQGRIDGNENIGVSPRNQGGVVTKIFVREGDYVTKGQVLAELDAEVMKQQLVDLQNKLAFATDIYNRQKALWDQKIGSEIQYLKAKNDMETVQNGINTLQDQIKMSVITSPIDGNVEDIPIKVGQMASSASPIPCFRIVNFSKAKALADVGESYSSKVKTGDAVKVFLPDLNVEVDQKVTFASKYINPTNRTFLVEVALPGNGPTYRANMIAVLRIKDYSNPAAISIPQALIQSSRDDGLFVFVAIDENGKKVARKRPVITLNTFNGLTEIVSGLNEGDRIITAGYKDLYDGQLINF